ncbi:hypothetical protein C8R44DRAFT_886814 [Mycena epipterygia]|nr:hypothetical protein C8R44DRAFT_886814 [Mycena epipterygia]
MVSPRPSPLLLYVQPPTIPTSLRRPAFAEYPRSQKNVRLAHAPCSSSHAAFSLPTFVSFPAPIPALRALQPVLLSIQSALLIVPYCSCPRGSASIRLHSSILRVKLFKLRLGYILVVTPIHSVAFLDPACPEVGLGLGGSQVSVVDFLHALARSTPLTNVGAHSPDLHQHSRVQLPSVCSRFSAGCSSRSAALLDVMPRAIRPGASRSSLSAAP